MRELFLDESISSWVERKIFYDSIGYSRENNELLKLFIRGRVAIDIDYYEGSDLKELIALLNYVPPGFADRSVPYCDVYSIPSIRRTNFCPECLAEDLRSARTAVWRQAWSFGWSVICEKHNCPLESLQKSNVMYHVGNRGELACKMVVDKSSRPVTSIGAFERNIEFETSINEVRFSAIRAELFIVAKAMQHLIKRLILFKTLAGSYELTILLDLISITLRGYEKEREAVPYCFQLVKKLTGENYAFRQMSGVGVQEKLQGMYDSVEVLPRMFAFTLVAVLLRYPGAEMHWLRICNLFKDVGILVPKDRRHLFTIVSGEPEIGIKQWFLNRLHNQPKEFRALFREFYI